MKKNQQRMALKAYDDALDIYNNLLSSNHSCDCSLLLSQLPFFPLFCFLRAFAAFSASVSLFTLFPPGPLTAAVEVLAERIGEALGLFLFVVSTIMDDPISNPRIFSNSAVADLTLWKSPDMIYFVATLHTFV